MNPARGLRRWLRFNSVGVIGCGVQLGVLALLVHAFDVPVLVATAIAVEAAIVHNFVWHQRWTWRDRPAGSTGMLRRFVSFHVLNGAVSLMGNLAVMHVLTQRIGIDPVTANVGAVLGCSLVNFCTSELLVFRAGRVTASAIAAFLLIAMPAAAEPPDALAIELQPATLAAWQAYEQKVDERYRRVTTDRMPFLVHDEFRLEKWRDVVRGGGVAMAQVQSPIPGGARPSVPDGKIHHWVGAVFVPGVTVADVVRRLQQGAGHEAGAYEDVLTSKLLRKDGDQLDVYLKLRRQSVITVVYNTEHTVVYRRLGAARATSRSVATKIAELADPGTPREHEKPVGSDRGFLWRLNAYWRYEQVDGGVVIECESISLSRGVPTLLRPFVGGVVDGIARDALEKTLMGVRTVAKG